MTDVPAIINMHIAKFDTSFNDYSADQRLEVSKNCPMVMEVAVSEIDRTLSRDETYHSGLLASYLDF